MLDKSRQLVLLASQSHRYLAHRAQDIAALGRQATATCQDLSSLHEDSPAMDRRLGATAPGSTPRTDANNFAAILASSWLYSVRCRWQPDRVATKPLPRAGLLFHTQQAAARQAAATQAGGQRCPEGQLAATVVDHHVACRHRLALGLADRPSRQQRTGSPARHARRPTGRRTSGCRCRLRRLRGSAKHSGWRARIADSRRVECTTAEKTRLGTRAWGHCLSVARPSCAAGPIPVGVATRGGPQWQTPGLPANQRSFAWPTYRPSSDRALCSTVGNRTVLSA